MTHPITPPVNDMDGAWKEAFTVYLERFFAFCFPAVHADIDWARGFEFLDKELQKIVPQSETGRRSVDMLVKVWRRGGDEQWVLIHIEVQAQFRPDFPDRVFQYYCRIVDRYGRPVASFVVLADDNPNWKPDHLTRNLWGCKVEFTFPMVKLTDLAADPARLEQSDNPFAVIILAHLKAMQTSGDPSQRRIAKVRLIKSLYDRWGRDEIRKLVRLIDWLVMLPKELESQVIDEIESFELEKKVSYITSFERIGRERGEAVGEARGEARGLRDGISLSLKLKFGEAGAALMQEVGQIDDLKLLRRIFDSIEGSNAADNVRQVWMDEKH